ncbi:hypothetical protein SASPL_101626 [Salvia splendens]|uniref:Uncharacterized protein n=1 Tax=Salvia splendens TaxID=180675 RepID=A0A8X9ADY9_SALSN|nr:hypothetical protein SASPL_101626 [Salvia splendens]
MNMSLDSDFKPRIDMEFDSLDDALMFRVQYGGKVGFGITEVQAHEIDLAYDVGLNRKSSFDLMTRQAGRSDVIGYTILDAKNYLRSKRQRSIVYGEVGYARMFIDYEYLGFKRCMYGFEEETMFEEAWSNLLTQFNHQDNKWLKHMYSVEEKWA